MLPIGAIPPLAELQAQRWIYDLVCSPKFRPCFNKIFEAPRRSADTVDPYELDYKLHCREKTHDFARTKRGVDQEAYAYQLAVDMGAAPTWHHVWRKHGTEVFLTWAMGPNFPTKFRLVGPWSNAAEAAEAARLMKHDGELGKVVRRTGGTICKFGDIAARFFLLFFLSFFFFLASFCFFDHLLTITWQFLLRTPLCHCSSLRP